jgi:hypothetical protein
MTNELRDGLEKIMKADAVDTWYDTYNEAFGGLKPSEVVRRGKEGQLWRMIHLLEAGMPT